MIAYVTAKVGREDEVRNALLELVARTRNERGCVNYDLHESNATPVAFAIYENWKHASDLDAHAKSGDVRAFINRGKMADRLEPSEITKSRGVWSRNWRNMANAEQ